MRAKNLDIKFTAQGDAIVSFELCSVIDLKPIQAINTELYDITIKKHNKMRTIDANAYLWVLCQKLAKVLGSTKNEVYRHAIKQVGRFEPLPIRNDAVERWAIDWNSQALGNYCEIVGPSKLDGYTLTNNYYGSHTYNTSEMAMLINYIVEECEIQGIETLPPDELKRLKGMI